MASQAQERYRREQEEFVSNHGGSSPRDIILAILPSVCGILLTATIFSLLGNNVNRKTRIFLEFILNIVPCVLCCTILSDSVTFVCLAMTTISILNVMIVIAQNRGIEKSKARRTIGRRAFLTNFRALTNVITAICILAVDFRIFPRKFAKTEVYGYSLMDTGVGLFVIANALVAPETRNFEEANTRRTIFEKMAVNSKSTVKNCAPLLILGIGRSVAVELSSYQKHVTEYGVHWNFFVTLAFVKMLTSTLSTFLHSRYSLIMGITIIAMHEYALSAGNLKKWILGDAPRKDFVAANREGLSSVPGYVGLYLIGIAIGRLIHSTYKNRDKSSKPADGRYSVSLKAFGRNLDFEYNVSMTLCVKLSLIAVQACAATLYCDSSFQISRRMANAGYCLWIVTLSCILLTLLLLVEVIIDVMTNGARENLKNNDGTSDPRGKRKKRVGFHTDDMEHHEETTNIRVPVIFQAVNYNGLVFFLIANLFTGILNMAVRTLYVNEITALQIILGYIALCIIFASVLYRYKIQLKA